ncbi:MAG: aminodeoxychorismate lyase, partial [Alphaproteobacteria bacterium]|nr:aminodeoxychorismate lyase [Alphaproteobacteria bacterium]
MTRRLLRFIFVFVLLILVPAGGILSWGYAQFTRPSQQAFDQTVVVTKGQGLKEIAAQLAK